MLQEVTNHAIPYVFPHLHLQLESRKRFKECLFFSLRAPSYNGAFTPALK